MQCLWKFWGMALAVALVTAVMMHPNAARAANFTVPLRQEHGVLFLEARINGVGGLLVTFDPGAGDTYTSYARSRLLGAAPKSVCLADACFAAEMQYFDGNPNALAPKHDVATGQIAGSIGPALLQRYVATIDYGASTLTLVPVEAFSPARDARRLPLTFDTYGLPVVQAAVNGIAGAFELDVRAPHSMLFSPFLERTKLPQQPMNVRVGGYEVRDAAFMFSSATSGKFADPALAGLLGNNVLSQFVVTLDLPHHNAYLSQR